MIRIFIAMFCMVLWVCFVMGASAAIGYVVFGIIGALVGTLFVGLPLTLAGGVKLTDYPPLRWI